MCAAAAKAEERLTIMLNRKESPLVLDMQFFSEGEPSDGSQAATSGTQGEPSDGSQAATVSAEEFEKIKEQLSSLTLSYKDADKRAQKAESALEKNNKEMARLKLERQSTQTEEEKLQEKEAQLLEREKAINLSLAKAKAREILSDTGIIEAGVSEEDYERFLGLITNEDAGDTEVAASTVKLILKAREKQAIKDHEDRKVRSTQQTLTGDKKPKQQQSRREVLASVLYNKKE